MERRPTAPPPQVPRLLPRPDESDPGSADARFDRALLHPFRDRLVQLLVIDGPRTASELAASTGRTRRAVAYHLGVLEEVGAVERAEVQREGHTRLGYRHNTRALYLGAQAWGRVPLATRRELIAGDLAQIHQDAQAAFANGGFDDADVHVSWTPVVLDRPAHDAVAALLDETLERLLAIQTAAAYRLEGADASAERIPSEIAMLHFRRETSPARAPEPPEGVVSISSGLNHLYELGEELAAELPSPTPDCRLIAERARAVAELAELLAARGAPASSP
jgi:DNA-binding transcriptional ArsR family regulator